MKLLVFLASFIVLVGCKETSGTSNTAQQQGVPGTPSDPSSPPSPSLPPPPPPDPSQYPVADWETTRYDWIDYQTDVHGHIVLSKAWPETIAIEVSLVDDTAITPTDYNGFYGLNGAHTKSVVFPPGSRLYHMNSWEITDTHVCGRKFLMRMRTSASTHVFLGPDVPVFIKCR